MSNGRSSGAYSGPLDAPRIASSDIYPNFVGFGSGSNFGLGDSGA